MKEKLCKESFSSGAERVLIVDDHRLIIEKIIGLLNGEAGIEAVDSCQTYADAIKRLPQFRPSVVLLDINMPDGNGIVLLRYIKMHHPGIRVIMVTNQYNSFYENLCLQTGASHFLDKSNHFDRLPALIAPAVS